MASADDLLYSPITQTEIAPAPAQQESGISVNVGIAAVDAANNIALDAIEYEINRAILPFKGMWNVPLDVLKQRIETKVYLKSGQIYSFVVEVSAQTSCVMVGVLIKWKNSGTFSVSRLRFIV